MARDFGGALLALGTLVAWPALAQRTPLRRAAPAAFLVFAVPHLVFHIAHAGELPTGDDVVDLALLALGVAIPLALLLVPEGASGPGRLPAPGGANGWRLPPARSRHPVVRVAYWIPRRRFGRVIGPPR